MPKKNFGNNGGNGNQEDLMIDFFDKSEEILLGSISGSGSSKKEEKKRGRKAKKMNDKEILYAHKIEETQLLEDVLGEIDGGISSGIESSDDVSKGIKHTTKPKSKKTSPRNGDKKKSDFSSADYTKKNYENFAYLSAKERAAFEKKFTVPKNEPQEKFCKILKTKSKKIVIVNGPAGTGKTMLATEHGIRFFLTDTYEKLIFTRPSVSVDEDLGFLPGTLEEKMAPWVRPIYDVLYNFLTPKEVQQLMEEKIIEIAPLGYMRGRTFKNAWIVADEMQNATISQMKMLLTRLGENSRLVVTGDLQQYDRTFENNGLDDFLRRLRNRGGDSENIVSFEFQKSDIQREPVVKEVLDIYDLIT